MSSEKIYINESQLVLPGGELQVVGITPDWSVEIGGRLNGVHWPEEAICISALARYVDQPLLFTELTSAVLEEREVAKEFSAKENPIFKKSDLDDAVLEALSKLMYKPDSAFSKNIVLLGHGDSTRVSLFASVAHESYGLRKIVDFFTRNPNLEDLQRTYIAMFERDFNRIHGFLQSGSTTD